MKRVIIAGGNGLIGRALVKELVKEKISIIVLGSAKKIHQDFRKIKNSKIEYYQVPKLNFFHEDLIKKISKLDLHKECIFFNLAWRGKTSLTDGSIEDQLRNVSISCEFIELAKKLFIKKYVAVGSMEELIFQRHIESEHWLHKLKVPKLSWYALSKLSSKMQSEFLAYNYNIDFCYARISAAIDINLQTDKYIENSFKSLLKNKKIISPNNNQLYNISSTDELAKQLIMIGKRGINKRVYTLGTGESASLNDYFVKFLKIVWPESNIIEDKFNSEFSFLKKEDFYINDIKIDTGYKTQESSEILFNKLIRSSIL
jgi:nucleoside-diphosphate-sugar epimerase